MYIEMTNTLCNCLSHENELHLIIASLAFEEGVEVELL